MRASQSHALGRRPAVGAINSWKSGQTERRRGRGLDGPIGLGNVAEGRDARPNALSQAPCDGVGPPPGECRR